MLKTKKSYLIATIIFIVAEIILGYFIQTTRGKTYGILTVSSVALAFTYAILNLRKEKSVIFTVIALCFTVVADFFLCGLVEGENNQLIAMCVFNVTQLLYFWRIYRNHDSKNQKVVHLSVRVFLCIGAVVATILVLGDNVNALSIISLFYFANLFVNIIFAFIQFDISKLLSIGLLLFLFCDIFIGLSVMAESFIAVEEGSLIYTLNHLGVNMAWVFYVPSQTLIALSVSEDRLFSLKK